MLLPRSRTSKSRKRKVFGSPCIGVIVLLAWLPVQTALALSAFHVRVDGTAAGDGSLARSWDLQTALNHPATLRPGDTVWIHGGIYRGGFQVFLHGTASRPIVVRNYAGERVALEGGPTANSIALLIRSSSRYTWFWGLELRGPARQRCSAGPTPDASIGFGDGIATEQLSAYGGIKLINCLIHDLIDGCLFWKECQDAELYGNVIYNNGYDGPSGDRGHGHGIYAMNQTGRKLIAENILFNGYANGIQAYGADWQYADSLTFSGNVIVNSGANSTIGGGWNLIVGTAGTRPAVGDTIRENFTYRQAGGPPCAGVDIGWEAGQSGVAILHNYFVGSAAGDVALRLTRLTGATVTGNTVMGRLANFAGSDYPANTYLAAPPARGDTSFLRVNKYEPRRAHVVVYNWAGTDTVRVDVRGFAPAGSRCSLVNAQNVLGDAPCSGTVDAAGRLAVPMQASRWTVAAPSGGSNPASSFPGFGVFILTAGSGAPASAVGEKLPEGLPRTFCLEQNYPNPFNPATTIEFSLPERTPVTLKVFDALGNEVADLVSGVLEPGRHRYPWDGARHASGVYYCRLVAGSYQAVRKLLMVK